MKCWRTEIPDVLVLEPQRFHDERGWFMETFHPQRFEAEVRELGGHPPAAWVQDNESCSHLGVVRGLHYQLAPQAQGKLVRVTQGRIFDVAVDLRRDSPSFGRWVGIELDADEGRQLWIPPGFAHGFMSLAAGTRVVYKTTAPYAPSLERSVRWDDPALAIAWPSPGQPVLVSAKDAAAPLLTQAEVFETGDPGVNRAQ